MFEEDDFAEDRTTTGIVTLASPVSGDINFEFDRDWLQVPVTSGTIYRIEVDPQDFDEVELVILDPDEIFVAFETTFDAPAQVQFMANQSGTYFANISSFGETGIYEVSLTELAADDFPADETTSGLLVPGAPVNGAIQFAGDEDWFRIEVVEGQSYTLDMTGPFVDEVELKIADSFNNFIGSTSSLGDPLSISFVASETGVYFARARAFFQTVSYELALETDAPVEPVPNPGTGFSPDDFDRVIRGASGNDRLPGTALNDWLDGRDGRDNINGAAGNDYIIAGPGDDGFVRGGTGRDIFQFGLGDERVRIFDWEPGLDRVLLSDGLTLADLSTRVSSFNGIETLTLETSQGDRLELRGIGADGITVEDILTLPQNPFDRDNFDTVISDGAGDSRLTGTDLRDFITAGDGRDKINAGDGDDFIDAGPGNDGFVRGGAGADVFSFGVGSDEIKIFDWEIGIDRIALQDGLTFDDLAISGSEFMGVVTTSLRSDNGDRLQLRDVSPEEITAEDFLLI